ncbi:magnesium transporter MRS2-like, mitochondrial [Sigmodon hispidus]
MSDSALSTFTPAGTSWGTGHDSVGSRDSGGARTAWTAGRRRGTAHAGAMRACGSSPVHRSSGMPGRRLIAASRLHSHHGMPTLPAPAAARCHAVRAGSAYRAPEPGCLLRSRNPDTLRKLSPRCRYARPRGPAASAPPALGLAVRPHRCDVRRSRTTDASQATLASVAQVFAVTKFDKEGNVTSFERKKTELYHELALQARDLRFQHVMSITTRNNRIIMRMEYLKAVITPECLLILDYRNLNLEQWLFRELPSQLAGEGQLVTYPLPFEFRAIEALLQYWISTLQGKLSILQPLILETLDALVDPKHSSVDRSKLHVLLQNGKSLSELETDIKIFKESILELLDEEEMLEELCLTKWSDPQVFMKERECLNDLGCALSHRTGIDHAEEMELLLENYYRLAEDLSNEARELRVLIDDSQSIIFINLDSHRNVMMRLNLQLTMGTFSLSLFGLMGVAFGMNLESSLEEDHRVFWLITGIMFMGSGLIWRRLLSFLGRQLEAPLPAMMASLPKKTLLADRRMEVKNSFRPEGLGASRTVLASR